MTEQVANANATVDLGVGNRSPWADEAPAINIGAEYRKDRLDCEQDELAQSGDLAGAGGEGGIARLLNVCFPPIPDIS